MKHVSTDNNLITARGLSKQFRAKDGHAVTTALSDVSLCVAPGECVAIVGSSGSGKSTLLYCLSGLDTPTEGQVSLLGQPLRATGQTAELTPRQSQGVGFVFQSYQLLSFLTVTDNILLPAKYTGQLSAAEQRLPELLERLGLADKAQAAISNLSGGQQQRVAIARALINQPSIIFADEPTGALDTKNAKEVINLLVSLPDSKRSVVMVTHDLEVASRASRVLVLSDGRIVQELQDTSPSEILAAMDYAKRERPAS